MVITISITNLRLDCDTSRPTTILWTQYDISYSTKLVLRFLYE